jgi:hypothetical protein
MIGPVLATPLIEVSVVAYLVTAPAAIGLVLVWLRHRTAGVSVSIGGSCLTVRNVFRSHKVPLRSIRHVVSRTGVGGQLVHILPGAACRRQGLACSWALCSPPRAGWGPPTRTRTDAAARARARRASHMMYASGDRRSRVHPARRSSRWRPLQAASIAPPAFPFAMSRRVPAGQDSIRRGRATRVPDREASRAPLRSRSVSREPSTCARATPAHARGRLSTFGAGCHEEPDRWQLCVARLRLRSRAQPASASDAERDRQHQNSCTRNNPRREQHTDNYRADHDAPTDVSPEEQDDCQHDRSSDAEVRAQLGQIMAGLEAAQTFTKGRGLLVGPVGPGDCINDAQVPDRIADEAGEPRAARDNHVKLPTSTRR